MEIDDSKVADSSHLSGKNSGGGFGRKKHKFHYEPQVFNAKLEKTEVPVAAGETVTVNISLAQYTSRANFNACFQL